MLLFASIANQFPRPTLSDPKNQSQDLNRPFESTLGISVVFQDHRCR
jgi:hypothetical protein